MDFDFSDDQEQLRDAVRKWVDKGYTFERRRAAVAAGGFDRAAWNELAELGLTALTVPEAHGGMGQGAIDAMVVAEELGRGIVLEPIAQAFIASFQALRHRVADMKMQLELARSMSYYASLKLGAPAAERRAAMARAKVQLGQSMRFVGQQSVQLHGGIGVTDEYIGSHYFKKLTQLEMTFGDTLHHLGEVSARMQDTAGVFA